jgi:hypothetical protein
MVLVLSTVHARVDVCLPVSTRGPHWFLEVAVKELVLSFKYVPQLSSKTTTRQTAGDGTGQACIPK